MSYRKTSHKRAQKAKKRDTLPPSAPSSPPIILAVIEGRSSAPPPKIDRAALASLLQRLDVAAHDLETIRATLRALLPG